MFKKISMVLLLFIFALTLTACGGTDDNNDPNDEPSTELNTTETDKLAMDFQYENTDFIADGIGEVELVRCVDGDTAVFTEGNGYFTVRFLGIDTPESTALYEPWGKPASEYTCDKLENAETLVLEYDVSAGRMDNYGTRYLAWVWYDGRLINLELIEEAYTKAKGSLDLKYGELIFTRGLEVQETGRRVWGEEDETYDYSLEGTQISIEELVTNYEQYKGTKVVITGVVSRELGGGAFIQQGDYGIYLFFNQNSPHLSQGNELLLAGLTVTEYPSDGTGAIQVSNYQARPGYSTKLSSDNIIAPTTVTVPEITNLHLGRLLKVEHLTVKSIYEGANGAFTVTTEDAQGNTITVRRDSDSPSDITVDMFQVGTTYTVVAPLSRYASKYQLMLTSADDVTIE